MNCNRIISDLNCNIIIQDEEFDENFVYVYVLQLNTSTNTITQVFIKEHEDEQIIFDNKDDGYYTLCTIKVPLDPSKPYYFANGRYHKQNIEVELQELINVNSEVSELEITYDYYFSTCKLKKCFIRLCQEIFDQRASTKCEPKYKNDSNYNRDLVWAALHVIEYLVEFEQYSEAQRILEKISGCNGLCKESSKGGCGCQQ